MKKYAVSVYSNMTGELETDILLAESVEDAFNKSPLSKDWAADFKIPTYNGEYIGDEEKMLEALKQYMFDNDMAINIVRID